MANVFKNYQSASIGTTETTVYTVPALTTSVLLGCNIANITASEIAVTAKLGTTHLIKDVPIPAGSSLSFLDGKIIAEAAETINVTSNTAASVDVVLSVMEQT